MKLNLRVVTKCLGNNNWWKRRYTTVESLSFDSTCSCLHQLPHEFLQLPIECKGMICTNNLKKFIFHLIKSALIHINRTFVRWSQRLSTTISLKMWKEVIQIRIGLRNLTMRQLKNYRSLWMSPVSRLHWFRFRKFLATHKITHSSLIPMATSKLLINIQSFHRAFIHNRSISCQLSSNHCSM